MKDMIIQKKVKGKEELSKGIANITTPIKATQTSSPADFTRKYMWATNNVDLDVGKKLGLIDIKKY